MPFNVEFTNRIKLWESPNMSADIEGDEFTISVAAELPVWLVLPDGLQTFEHTISVDNGPIKVTIFQDCLKYYYGDHLSKDNMVRYKVFHSSEAKAQIEAEPLTDRKYIEKLRSVVRFTRLIHIQERNNFILHQLRPLCEILMEACNRIMEAERSTFFSMAWIYPYRLSFLSIDIFWISLYKSDKRIEAFPFLGNAAFVALNPPCPAVHDDFAKVTAAIGGQDTFPDWWLYYCKAATHHGQQNYREAVIEAVIALEMALSSFVRTKWMQRGVSNNAIDTAKRDVTLSTMINIELMVLSDTERKPSQALIGGLNKARKLRNDIVHERRVDVSESQSNECLLAIKEALLLLSPSIYNGHLMDSIVQGVRGE